MPNHITNHLNVFGKKKDVEKFYEDNSLPNGTHLSFGCAVPEPNWETKEIAVGGQAMQIFSDEGWYGWRCKNWGTKWDAYDHADIQRKKGDLDGNEMLELKYIFLTAWSPPLPWLESVTKKYPTLEFTIKFYDEDYPQCGMATAIDGAFTETYPTTQQEQFDFIQEHFPDWHNDEGNEDWRGICIKKTFKRKIMECVRPEVPREKIRKIFVEFDEQFDEDYYFKWEK